MSPHCKKCPWNFHQLKYLVNVLQTLNPWGVVEESFRSKNRNLDKRTIWMEVGRRLASQFPEYAEYFQKSPNLENQVKKLVEAWKQAQIDSFHASGDEEEYSAFDDGVANLSNFIDGAEQAKMQSTDKQKTKAARSLLVRDLSLMRKVDKVYGTVSSTEPSTTTSTSTPSTSTSSVGSTPSTSSPNTSSAKRRRNPFQEKVLHALEQPAPMPAELVQFLHTASLVQQRKLELLDLEIEAKKHHAEKDEGQ